MGQLKIRGVWGGTGEVGASREGVERYLDRLAAAGINAVFLGVKEGDGRICWPSERFPECVKPEYRDFDLPAVFLEECNKRGIEFHAWFIDYYEGEKSPAYQQHPEWAVLNNQGRPTADETLRGRRYDAIWMCPARRPGYTDQWLVPMYEEFASRYEVASIHHDYIRYPGDLAPDQYCFCDYCIEDMPRWMGFINEAHPDEPFFHDKYDRPYLEAHWEQSPRVLPPYWDKLDRLVKSRFLLDGSFFQTGRQDLDYFFYRYRIHQITEFARLSHEAVQRANPKVKLSGAIFKNPIHSGRFIGQDWREFARYMPITVPMDYRDHFPGTFEHYLDLLEETIKRQQIWAKEFEALYIGIAINFLFHEEIAGGLPFSPDKLPRAIERIASTGAEGAVLFCSWAFDEYGVWDQLPGAWV